MSQGQDYWVQLYQRWQSQQMQNIVPLGLTPSLSVSYDTSSIWGLPPPTPAAPPPPLPKELVAGPTLAVRTWVVGPDGSLCSVNDAYPWDPGTPFVAKCAGKIIPMGVTMSAPHVTPMSRCACGIYAVKRMSDLAVYQATDRVTGYVALWGKVIEHRLGYRSELAYPVALFDPTPAVPLPPGFPVVARTSRLTALAERYGIPVMAMPKE